ncbi:MAG: hypothetical protein KGI50_07370 [Patescibacteria group bacterium]|nr:hypothetical protein [Patescibacteria group bacterium]
MKIEIDLKDMLGDEYGNSESLAESVHRQVVDKLATTLKEGIENKINAEISILIQQQIKDVVSTQMPSLVDQLLNAEYRQVDRWGTVQKENTTVRKELVKAIQDQMQYSPKSYNSEKNIFTKSVDEAVAEHVKQFKKAYDATIIELLHKEAFEYAVNKMSEKLGLSVAKR